MSAFLTGEREHSRSKQKNHFRLSRISSRVNGAGGKEVFNVFSSFSLSSFSVLSSPFFLDCFSVLSILRSQVRSFPFDAEREREAAAGTLPRTARGRLGPLASSPLPLLLLLLLLGGSPVRRRFRFRRPLLRPLLPLLPLPLLAPPLSPRPSSRALLLPSGRATRCFERASIAPRRASRAG